MPARFVAPEAKGGGEDDSVSETFKELKILGGNYLCRMISVAKDDKSRKREFIKKGLAAIEDSQRCTSAIT